MGEKTAWFDCRRGGVVHAAAVVGVALGTAFVLGTAPISAGAAEGLGGVAARALQASADRLGEGAVSNASVSEAEDDVLLAAYGNAAQGFSLLVDAGAFAVSEGEGAGATFRLTSDPASYFAVSYVADWLGTPDVGEYLEEQLWHGQMGHGDTYVQISADGGEVVYLADVAMDAIAYGYVDADTGQNMVVIQAMEPRSDGSAVYWTLVASDESAEEVATALVVASATFRVGADAYQESNLWCAPEDLQARPAGTVYSLADPTVGDAGGSALVFSADAAATAPQEDGPSSASVAASATPRSPAAPAAWAPTYRLETYDGGYFTVTLPQGWTVLTSGEGAGFSLEAFDPANPNVRIVYYGELAFNMNEQMRDLFAAGTVQGGELGRLYALYAALPVLSPCTVANAVSLLPAYTQMALQNGAVDDGMSLMVSSCEVTSSDPITYFAAVPALAGYVQDDALVSANMVLTGGAVCRADFLGSAVTVGSGEYGFACAAGLWGIVAPTDVYDQVVTQLAPCVGTLGFSDSYVEQANAATDAVASAALYRSAESNAAMDKAVQDFDDYIMDRDRFTLSDGSQLIVERW